MSKVSDFWTNETPWDDNLSNHVGHNIIILGVEETETNYGRGYLVSINDLEISTTDDTPIVCVTSNKTIVKQIDTFVEVAKTDNTVFPLDAHLERVKGKDFSYFMLTDPK